jgi:hypothetical protein
MNRNASSMPSAVAGDRTGRWTLRVTLVILGLLVALITGKGVRVATLPVDQMVSWNVMIDDGYYYLQVARNLARGHGSTFDRVNKTNGFQPLWTLALVPIYWFTDDPGSGMRAALVLAVLLGGLSLVLSFVALRRLVGAGAALLFCGLVVANPYFLRILQGGLETPILFACMAGLMAFISLLGRRVLAAERRPCIGLGLLLAATVLARVDTFLILAPLGLLVVLWGSTRRSRPSAGGRAEGPPRAGAKRQILQRALWIGLPALVVLLPYVIWNWASHGSPVPISGQVKAWVAATHTPTWELFRATEQWRGVTRTLGELSWPWNPDGREPPLEAIGGRLVLPGLLLGVLVLRLLWSRRARANRLAMILLMGSTVGIAAHGLYMFFIYRSSGHWNYHYFFPFAVLYNVLLAVTAPLCLTDVGLLVDRLVRGRLRRGIAALGAALVLPLLALLAHQGIPAAEKRYADLRRPPQQSFRKCRLDAARNIARNFPREAVFGSWWAGTLGYFSDRRVINLDGVVSSGEYFRRYLKTDRVDRYILEGPPSHLIDFFWRDPLHPHASPAARAFFWEHDKEHIFKRLRSKLRLVARIPFRGPSGMYLVDIVK